MRDSAEDLTCLDCSGLWLRELDFIHADNCRFALSEASRLADDLARLSGTSEFERDTTNHEEELAMDLGMLLGLVAGFHAPLGPTPTGRHRRTLVRLVDGERRRISIDGRDLSTPGSAIG